ncbi:MAG TPA: Gfo/Idh/MocA family oxidoreductase [Acidobacteriaceae bacterium]
MMTKEHMDRRAFLTSVVGTAAAFSAMPDGAFGLAGGRPPMEYIVESAQAPEEPSVPAHRIKFAVIGINHYHIFGQVDAVIHGGGDLVALYASEPDLVANFVKRYPQVKTCRSEAEILEDPSIKLVASSIIPNQRAPLGIRVMRHGKDYLSDKPGFTTLEQLDEVRKVQKETGQIYAIMYSERLEVKAAVKAGDLVKDGAIGKVVQTVNLAPHQIQQKNSPGRPEWFWDPVKNGGILCDIGSHQADQFLFYTGSTAAEVTASQIANVNHPQHPSFQDFGDMMLHGSGGAGYVRVDWFTPDGVGTWGDGRLFILGTEGYIELRKYVDITGRKGGNHLFIVDQKQARYIDCNNVPLPFGGQFVSDILNRTHTAQDQAGAFLAAELVLKAQRDAKVLTFTS